MRRIKVSYWMDPITVASLRGMKSMTNVPMSWLVEEAVLEKVQRSNENLKTKNALFRMLATFSDKKIECLVRETRQKILSRIGGWC